LTKQKQIVGLYEHLKVLRIIVLFLIQSQKNKPTKDILKGETFYYV